MADLFRHEQELDVCVQEGVGAVRARKRVDVERADELVDRRVEHLDELERVPAGEGDSGEIETLPDGSVSIPILEEELVVSKRTVVRERVVVRKRTETTHERVEAELRREELDIDVEGDVDVVDET